MFAQPPASGVTITVYHLLTERSTSPAGQASSLPEQCDAGTQTVQQRSVKEAFQLHDSNATSQQGSCSSPQSSKDDLASTPAGNHMPLMAARGDSCLMMAMGAADTSHASGDGKGSLRRLSLPIAAAAPRVMSPAACSAAPGVAAPVTSASCNGTGTPRAGAALGRSRVSSPWDMYNGAEGGCLQSSLAAGRVTSVSETTGSAADAVGDNRGGADADYERGCFSDSAAGISQLLREAVVEGAGGGSGCRRGPPMAAALSPLYLGSVDDGSTGGDHVAWSAGAAGDNSPACRLLLSAGASTCSTATLPEAVPLGASPSLCRAAADDALYAASAAAHTLDYETAFLFPDLPEGPALVPSGLTAARSAAKLHRSHSATLQPAASAASVVVRRSVGLFSRLGLGLLADPSQASGVN